MPEPTSTTSAGAGLAALAIALLGPLAGPYAVILFAALSGALWATGATPTETRMQACWLVVRLVLMASVFTGLVAHLLHAYAGVEPGLVFGPVAFLIAAIGDQWRAVLARLANAARAWADRAGPRGSGGGRRQ